MSRLVWGETGSRFYEAGVDRGVLFPPNAAAGVPWNGLISVKEAPSGGDPQAYYQDGIKYIQIASAEEFDATIEAFSAPPEFTLCDGTANVYAGLFITQQPRKQFGLSYRTLIGNDVAAEAYGYKIHLVWNALAKPAARARVTISDTTEPLDLSWDITTVPPVIQNFKPSAHMVVNSTLAAPNHLAALENIIYGQDGIAPRMPSQQEVVDIFAGAPITVTDNGDGTFSASGPNTNVGNPTPDTFNLYNPAVIDNGDGTFTATTGVDDG